VAKPNLADLIERAERTRASELRNAATGETELYLSIENTIEERLRAFNKMMRAKMMAAEAAPSLRRKQKS
jgi:hypothetical protein